MMIDPPSATGTAPAVREIAAARASAKTTRYRNRDFIAVMFAAASVAASLALTGCGSSGPSASDHARAEARYQNLLTALSSTLVNGSQDEDVQATQRFVDGALELAPTIGTQ